MIIYICVNILQEENINKMMLIFFQKNFSNQYDWFGYSCLMGLTNKGSSSSFSNFGFRSYFLDEIEDGISFNWSFPCDTKYFWFLCLILFKSKGICGDVFWMLLIGRSVSGCASTVLFPRFMFCDDIFVDESRGLSNLFDWLVCRFEFEEERGPRDWDKMD